MKNKVFVFLISAVGLFSLLCLWSDYRVDPLPMLSEKVSGRKVNISSKVLDAEESKKYLNSDLLSRGYQPIQLTIDNQTATSFFIEGTNISQVPTREIARAVSKSSIPRSVGYKVASFFFWPFAVPSTIDGIKTVHKNRQMSKDFVAKSVKQEKLAPFSTLHRILFIRTGDLQDHLIVTLSDEKTTKIEDHKIALS
jgi:hypothetical protein